ncbi:unnamed protein product [Bursaphelenchus okinawaensis]|uniref:Uncharacterized protein n=1 Tax=Bursaphelenchus okinawaensis TaxID=465554 RepID=A0A811JU26_9BILA|nr:unnamed protein product [Bursaphelenchus okinawaensis]CAG9082957.1 unnamed protein product [Bursaphelenchus okinawaensis]
MKKFNVSKKKATVQKSVTVKSEGGTREWTFPSEEKGKYLIPKSQLTKLELSSEEASFSAKKHQTVRIPIPPLPPSNVDSTSVMAYTNSLKQYRNLLDRHIDAVSKSLM